jgi:hypothetical protein
MKRVALIAVVVSVCLFVTGIAQAEMTKKELIANAKSAAPARITDNATFKTMEGEVLKEGSNGWTCYSGSKVIGPMCNQPQWDALLGALMKKEPFDPEVFSVSYMLAGEGDAIGTSNTDPFATGPTDDNDWIKEGPHLMIIVPEPEILEGLSTDPNDPVYVMWKGTPYAHIMVKIAAED